MSHLITLFPFLILGCWVSGLMAVWLDPATVQLTIPKNKVVGWLTAGCLGLLLPLGGVGLWPVLRRLYQLGWPPFMVATAGVIAPVFNALTLLTLWTEGVGQVWLWVVGLAWLPAGLLAWWLRDIAPSTPLALEKPAHFTGRLWQTIEIGGDELLDWGRYLIVGAMILAVLTHIGAENWLWAGLSQPLLAPLAITLLAVIQAPGSWLHPAALTPLQPLPAGLLALYLLVGASFNLIILLTAAVKSYPFKNR